MFFFPSRFYHERCFDRALLQIPRDSWISFDIWLNQNRQIVIPVYEIGFQRMYAIDSQKSVPGSPG